MSDPSLLVTMPTAGDPTLAPAGRDLLFVLAPCPNLDVGKVNWSAEGDSYARQVLATAAERLLPGLDRDADILDVVTPADWARQGMTAGSPFALAHTFSQTGPFRPANLVRGVDNAVLAGGSTVPGVGVPTALLSGRLAAERITGPTRRSFEQTDDSQSQAGTGMTNIELHAAGIEDQRLRESYRYCRRLNAQHGRTYFLATRLLTPSQRPAVHALYGFARYADDILDDLNSDAGAAERAARLELLASRFAKGDADSEPVLPAVLDTARTYRIPVSLFDEFLTSMRMDLTVTDYPDRPALNRYMRGSAEVIGLQMLPILGTVGPLRDAEPCAEALGRAFQLTNFLRDINEDLDRNRVYLPADELAAFGVDRELLTWCHDNQRTDPRVRQALAAQHEITRAIYRRPTRASRCWPRSRGRA